eukprot:gene10351-12241_t
MSRATKEKCVSRILAAQDSKDWIAVLDLARPVLEKGIVVWNVPDSEIVRQFRKEQTRARQSWSKDKRAHYARSDYSSLAARMRSDPLQVQVVVGKSGGTRKDAEGGTQTPRSNPKVATPRGNRQEYVPPEDRSRASRPLSARRASAAGTRSNSGAGGRYSSHMPARPAKPARADPSSDQEQMHPNTQRSSARKAAPKTIKAEPARAPKDGTREPRSSSGPDRAELDGNGDHSRLREECSLGALERRGTTQRAQGSKIKKKENPAETLKEWIDERNKKQAERVAREQRKLHEQSK